MTQRALPSAQCTTQNCSPLPRNKCLSRGSYGTRAIGPRLIIHKLARQALLVLEPWLNRVSLVLGMGGNNEPADHLQTVCRHLSETLLRNARANID
jgi:hypothetical protein